MHPVLKWNRSAETRCPLVGAPCCVSMSVWWGKRRTLDWQDWISRHVFPSLFIRRESNNVGSTTSVDILYVLVTKSDPFPRSLWGIKTYSWSSVACSGSTDTLSIPIFAFPPPPSSKRGSIHSSIWPNQVWIELTTVCQSFPSTPVADM